MSRYSREFRFNDNFELMSFDLSSPNEFPVMQPAKYREGLQWIGFNYANSVSKGNSDLRNTGIHFYLDDYQFARIWPSLRDEARKLQAFGAVLTPDYSMYRDWPLPQQKWSHYKAQFVGAYLQRCGALVYPSVNWSAPDSFDWCFEGVPIGGCVAVYSVGTQMSEDTRKAFKYGYDAMLEHVMPEVILFHGQRQFGLRGNIVPIEPFHAQIRRRCKNA